MDLQIFWFIVIGVLWGGYFLLEGFDFGVGMLLPFLPRNERERGYMFRTIGPVWDGNEVWLVVAGGATFAAFPAWYATMFSGFYIALLLLLFFLIIRVLSFEWRSKAKSPRWRTAWLWCNTIGSLGASLIWGVAFSALLYGVPINSSGDFSGTFWDLFNLYTVLGGVAVVLLFACHGATFLTLRTTGDLCERAKTAARSLSVAAAVAAGGFLALTVEVAVNHNDKDVFPPILPAAAGILALVLAIVFVFTGRSAWAFAMTALGAVLVVATVFTSLYPRVMVSSTDFANSLTVDGAASQHYTLAVMTVVALICVPIDPALPGLDVPRLPGAGGRGRASALARRVARVEDGRLADRLRRCPRWIGDSCGRRARRGRCSSSTSRSASSRQRSSSSRRRCSPGSSRGRFTAPRWTRCGPSSCCSRSPSPRGERARGRSRSPAGARRRRCSPSCGWRWCRAGSEPSPLRWTASRPARSRPPPSRGSTRSSRTSRATSRRSCSRASCRSSFSAGSPGSTSSPRLSCC